MTEHEGNKINLTHTRLYIGSRTKRYIRRPQNIQIEYLYYVEYVLD